MINPWFKFYAGEYLSDPKILRLNGNERSCWLTLLCQASQNNGKEIKFLDEKQLLMMSGVMEDIKVLEKFEKLGMITLCNDIVTVINWEKRQYSEGYDRVKKFRNKNVTPKITIEEKRREEKRRDKEELPIWLNKKAWEAWQQHRKEKKKSLTPTSMKLQLKFLEENKEDHAEIIRNSITNGWTGLFPLKDTKQVRQPKRYTEPDMSKEDNERRRVLDGQVESLATKMKI